MTSISPNPSNSNFSSSDEPYLFKSPNEVLNAEDWNGMQLMVRRDVNDAFASIAALTTQIQDLKRQLESLQEASNQIATDLETHDHTQGQGRTGKPIKTESMVVESIGGEIICPNSCIIASKLTVGGVDTRQKFDIIDAVISKLDAALDAANKELNQNSIRLADLENKLSGKIQLKSWKDDYLHRPDTMVDPKVTAWPEGIGNQWTIKFLP